MAEGTALTQVLRLLIESGAWPAGEKEARRLARQAVLKISARDRQTELYERLFTDLSTLELEIICSGNGYITRRAALSTLDEIEAANRLN